MKNTILTVAAMFVLSLPAAGQQQATTPSGEVLTLERALSLALEHNRGLRIAQIDTAKAQDQIDAMRTRRLPKNSVSILGSQLLNKFSFEFEQGVFGTYPGIGPVPATNTMKAPAGPPICTLEPPRALIRKPAPSVRSSAPWNSAGPSTASFITGSRMMGLAAP